jgi:hypothetical protein
MITSPGHVPPGVATVILQVTAQAYQGRAGPNPGAGAGRGPDHGPARKADRERQGRSSRRLMRGRGAATSDNAASQRLK